MRSLPFRNLGRLLLIALFSTLVLAGCNCGEGTLGNCPAERCDNIDNDCDGETDELDIWVGKGDDCRVGVGACQSGGVFICNPDDRQGPLTCSGTPGGEGSEICNGLDDDCDGFTDEDPAWSNRNDLCTVQLGGCVAAGIFVCDLADPTGPTVCSAEPGPPIAEICDGFDNDCDGETDEEPIWADLGEQCTNGTGTCERASIRGCDPADPAGPTLCLAVPDPAGTEVCDGLDNDCDGLTDEEILWADKGTPCVDGIGACEKPGIQVCDPATPDGPTICNAIPGTGLLEICNGLDDDCDGVTDNGAAWAGKFGPCSVGVGACAAAGLMICDGADPAGPLVCNALPGTPSTEACNGLDDDCNGSVDDDPQWTTLGTICNVGVGQCRATGVEICDVTNPGGSTLCSVSPGGGGTEICDGLDNDCDGQTDEEASWSDLGTVCSVGSGICTRTGVRSCDSSNPAGPSVCDAVVGSAGTESCNGLDDDCDGQTDEEAAWVDLGTVCTTGAGTCERSGVRICDAAAPAGPTVCDAAAGTTGTEVCDGLDNDCDGQTDEDVAWSNKGQVCNVGAGGCQESGTFICDPTAPADPTICSANPAPPASEICDGLDNDCDGQTDEDVAWADLGTICREGLGTCEAVGIKVCDPGAPLAVTVCSVTAGAAGAEVCNGLDDDCNGSIDDGGAWADLGAGCTSGIGVCAASGVRVCDPGSPAGPTVCSATAGGSGVEVCNGLDDDCNGSIDDGAVWADLGAGCTSGLGVCAAAGVKVCDAGDPPGPTVCSAIAGAAGVEACNGLDDDCNGSIDDGATWADLGDGCTAGAGICAQAGSRICDSGSPAGPTVCSAVAGAAGAEVCNGLDDDCDGSIDDGAAWTDLGDGCTVGAGICAAAGVRVCDGTDPAGPSVCSAVAGGSGIEVCNGLDDDCDGSIDEGVTWADLGDGCTAGVGICSAAGVRICDPGNASGATVCSATPGALGAEVCDGLDNDCDGSIDEGAAWADLGDGCTAGLGVCAAAGVRICDAANTSGPTVCSATPGGGGIEVCNGLDDDCDGTIDDGALWADLGAGCTSGLGVCTEAGAKICDSTSPSGPTICSAVPGASGSEVCNGLDDDCDGTIDDGALWVDRGDGCSVGVGVCSRAGSLICDTADPTGPTVCSVVPGTGSAETCNGLDDDCDGSIDDGATWADQGDGCTVGVGACTAAGVRVCDPGSPAGPTVCSASPGAPVGETCNGLDDDCDGSVDDGAAWADLGTGCTSGLGICAEAGARICDPGDPAGPTVCSATPGSAGAEVCNGLDDDCDGAIDDGALWADRGDGCTAGLGICEQAGSRICDGADPAGPTICSATPGASSAETCNGLDDDCDGSIDDGALWADLGTGCTEGIGACSAAGVKVCDGGAPAGATVCSATAGAPVGETCNGLDDDCDGSIDDGATWGDLGDGCTVGTGICAAAGVRVCDPGNAPGPTVCSASAGPSGVESCNGLDDDCDGSIDEGAAWADLGDGCTAGLGICVQAGSRICDLGDPVGPTVCSATPGSAGAEVCNGLDDDCDGAIDDGALWADQGDGCTAGLGICEQAGSRICDGADPAGPTICSATPGASSAETCNGLDDDCDGSIDDGALWADKGDGCTDGTGVCTQAGSLICNLADPAGATVCSATASAGGAEVCNGLDDDCDGSIDEGAVWADLGDGCSAGLGVCAQSGSRICDGGDPTGPTVCSATAGAGSAEVCDGLDNDCDGGIDEGAAWADKGSGCTSGVGVCEQAGSLICNVADPAGATVCSATPGAGGAEVCNGLDDDCDGAIDDGALWVDKGSGCTSGVGVCEQAGSRICNLADPAGATVCSATPGPGSAETCNGLDDDCDGTIDDGALWADKGDGCTDGAGVCTQAGSRICNVADPAGATVCSATASAGSAEVCNGLDDDCDGSIDEGAVWADLGDGCSAGLGVCAQSGSRICDGGDPAGPTVCSATAGAGSAEVCDGLDNDCDGGIDEGAAWADLGNGCTSGVGVCSQAGSRICDPGDTSGPTVCSATPGAAGAEVCNGLDDDCDGSIDDGALWADKGSGCTSGVGVCEQAGSRICNVADPAGVTVCSAAPGASGVETCNGLDDDCDGTIDDGALWADKGSGCTAGAGVCAQAGSLICNVADPAGATVCSATPGAGSAEVCNGLDDDCDGGIDEGAVWADKGDGCTAGVGVCAQSGSRICDGGDPTGPTVCSATAGAGSAEVCDGLDNDCDGGIDEGAAWSDLGAGCTAGQGICAAAGVKICDGGAPAGATVCSATPGASGAEVCNGLDDDCDGTIDDGALWANKGSGCTTGIGVCEQAGSLVCNVADPAGATVCSATPGASSAETCNGLDDDCDGSIDDGALWADLGTGCTAGQGICAAAGVKVCDGGAPAGATVCSATPGAGGAEVCNGLDDDCDGGIDEGAVWADKGDGCTAGVGVCAQSGSRICDGGDPAGPTVCSATAGAGSAEVCDGLDNDCDGGIDEGAAWSDLGAGCTAGQGICAAAGVKVCDGGAPAGATVCSATPGASGAEVCNGLDDDCDGTIDDGALWANKGSGCTTGIGVCEQAGSLVCNVADPAGATVCSATPGASGAETCNGLDDDCDGTIDDGALWANKGSGCTAGAGVCAQAGSLICNVADPAGATVCSATPGAGSAEVCNGLDDDCDGSIDDGALWADLGDGCTAGVGVCAQSGSRICDGSDPAGATVCSATAGAGSAEVCDGLDNDCDGGIDEGAAWADKGSGCTSGVGVCEQAGSLICNLADPAGATVCSATPGASGTETCNGLDDDCDGSIDDGALWADRGNGCTSGVGVCEQAGSLICNVADPAGATVCSATPGASGTETCNGLDDDCDGTIDDGALWADLGTGCSSGQGICAAAGVKVCDGGAPAGATVCSATPGASGVESCNGLDDDCDGTIDDGALWTDKGDGCSAGVGVCAQAGSLICNVADPAGATVCSATPGAGSAEVCDGLDNDCDSSIDEGALWVDRGDGCTAGVGVCSQAGSLICNVADPAGATVCSATAGAGSAETCNGLDDDCDGTIDDGALWADRGNGCTSGVGVCEQAGSLVCNIADPAGATVCSATPGAGSAESCNGLDDDCDGTIDDGALWADKGSGCTAGTGVCAQAGSLICNIADPAGATVCSATPGAGSAESCNGLDDDCDGTIDDGALWADKGDGCSAGTGVCAQGGSLICNVADPAGATVCSATPGAGGSEVCNGLDDDCDGAIDNGATWADLGDGCTAGAGICAAAGVKICDGGTPAGPTICSATPGASGIESCNGLDDDCDGVIDDGATWADKGDGCTAGVGICAQAGSLICNTGDPAGATVCSASPGPSGTESCNGLDDDCDGSIDDGATWADLGDGCTAGTGICAAAGVKVCDGGAPAGPTICSASPGPSGSETCNGLDDDCDGTIDDGATWADKGDGCAAGVGICAQAGSLICNIADPAGATVCSASPGPSGSETCNGLDDDCDGAIDDGALWADLGDGCFSGTGVCAEAGVKICDGGTPAGATICSATPGTGGLEICNGLDDDCDGPVDEGLSAPPCVEQDGVCSSSEQTCGGASGWLACTGPEYGGSYEPTELSCDALDNDCDGNPDNGLFAAPCPLQDGVCSGSRETCGGGSGWSTCSATEYGGDYQLAENLCDGLDNDCDSFVDEGYATLGQVCFAGDGACRASGTNVCNGPGNGVVCSATPGAGSGELCNDVDDDCDTNTDEDFPTKGTVCNDGLGECRVSGVYLCDGPGTGVECSVTAPSGVAETCDDFDNDCDGGTDEDFPTKGTVCNDGLGECRVSGVYLCDGPGTGVECSVTAPGGVVETCDDLDNDCDGGTDEDYPTKGSACSAGLGICQTTGTLDCLGDGSGVTCSATPGASGTESCNGLDDDCDGPVDEGLTAPACPLTVGVCAGSTQVCAGASGYLACDAGSYGVNYEVNEVSCDGLDNDCDGVTDDVDVDLDGHVDVTCGGDDCDDLNPLVFTGAAELCGDGVDNDCNFIAEDRDEDGDLHIDVACATYAGALPIDDCNDASALANPDETEVCGDGLDNDCNGSIDDVDLDGDLRIDAACGGVDCDDDDATVHPGAIETCDGKDNECNGVIDDKDLDVDGHVDVACVLYPGALPIDDCDDANVGVNPDMDEVCGNALDEDCSGSTNDKDVDGDGAVDTDPLCGGTDCDDDDPMSYPGATEVRDGRDNDCDADGRADEGLISVGDVIVTEIFYDSTSVPDENYEWFELFNPNDRPVNLRRWLFRDQPGSSQEIAIVNADVIVPPRGFATLCRTGDPLYNGGVTCDYEYGFLQFGNAADELILEYEATIVDEVWYDEGGPWPSATSGSLNLDPDSYLADNNSAGPWCNHPAGPPELANGDDASPGISNISCSDPIADPQVVAVHPDNGIEGGGTSIRIVGSGFSGTTDVQVDGSSCTAWVVDSDDQITCTTPAGTAGTVDVTIVEGAATDTLTNGFTYTREASANPELVTDISIDRPATLDVIRDAWCEGIVGVVTEGGTTGGGCPAGLEYGTNTLIAEVGYGTLGTDPRSNGSWIWFPSFCEAPVAGSDEFIGTIKVSTPGTYSYGFRVSLDGGDTWNYGDLDGSGNGFSAAQLGTMLVR